MLFVTPRVVGDLCLLGIVMRKSVVSRWTCSGNSDGDVVLHRAERVVEEGCYVVWYVPWRRNDKRVDGDTGTTADLTVKFYCK